MCARARKGRRGEEGGGKGEESEREGIQKRERDTMREGRKRKVRNISENNEEEGRIKGRDIRTQ